MKPEEDIIEAIDHQYAIAANVMLICDIAAAGLIIKLLTHTF